MNDVDEPQGLDLLRRAMELRGLDPDEVEAKAAEINEAGGVDVVFADDGKPPPQRRPVEEPVRDDEQIALLDPDAPGIGAFHAPDSGAPDTERLAAVAQYPKVGTDRRRVLDHIAATGSRGSIDEETSEALQMRLYTAAPRRTELVEMGWVVDSGTRRQTTTGALAAVWVLSESGRAAWQPPTYDRDA